jgi:sigma54-dependent transcription regulator
MAHSTLVSTFIAPKSTYYGQVKPENLVFNANLQEFSNYVSMMAALQTGGKITPEECFAQIKSLWTKLEQSKQQLGIGCNPFGA